MHKLAKPQPHILGPPWRCSNGKAGQDDQTSWSVASLTSERTWERLPRSFVWYCAPSNEATVQTYKVLLRSSSV